MIDSVPGIISAAPTPWTARERDQPALGRREADRRRRGREHDDADQEDAAAAEDVAEPAAGDQQDGERQRVGVDRPLQRRTARRRSVRWIDGSATFTTVLSSITMNSAKHIAASVHQRRLVSEIFTRSFRRSAYGGEEQRATRWRGLVSRP